MFVGKEGTKHIDRAFDFLWKFNEAHGIYVEADGELTKPEDGHYPNYEKIGFGPIDPMNVDSMGVISNNDNSYDSD